MRIGRPWWNIVDVDAPGVPRGMRWGDVEQFRDCCEQEGLVLGWSLPWRNFVILQRPAPAKFVFLMHCRQGGIESDVIPLTRDYWDAIMYLWSRMKNVPASHTIGVLGAIEKQRKEESVRAMLAEQEATREDVMESLWLERGYRTPKVAALPKKVVPKTKRARRRKVLRGRRRKLVLPQ